MAQKNRLCGMIRMVLFFGAIVVGCNTGGAGAPQTLSYTSTSGGKTYTLTITETRAVYTAKAGDSYVLTIMPDDKTSRGTVEASGGGIFTLNPSSPNAPAITITTTGVTISDIEGTITFTDGKTPPEQGPGILQHFDGNIPLTGAQVAGESGYNSAVELFDGTNPDIPIGNITNGLLNITLPASLNSSYLTPVSSYTTTTSSTPSMKRILFPSFKAGSQVLIFGTGNEIDYRAISHLYADAAGTITGTGTNSSGSGTYTEEWDLNVRVSPKLNTTYWQAKVVVYNSNPYGICS